MSKRLPAVLDKGIDPEVHLLKPRLTVKWILGLVLAIAALGIGWFIYRQIVDRIRAAAPKKVGGLTDVELEALIGTR